MKQKNLRSGSNCQSVMVVSVARLIPINNLTWLALRNYLLKGWRSSRGNVNNKSRRRKNKNARLRRTRYGGTLLDILLILVFWACLQGRREITSTSARSVEPER